MWKGKEEAKKGKSCGICWKGNGNDYLGFLEGLLIDFPTPWDHNILAARYCDVRAELRRAIQNIRRGNLTITLVHMLIIRPKTCLSSLDRILFIHPPSLIFHQATITCSHNQQHLGGRCFANKDNLKEKVEKWLSSMAADW